MKRNYSELIKDKAKRQLTAKGNKFLWRCIDISADMRGTSRYDPRMKVVKEKLINVIEHLIIDKEYSTEQIKELVQKSMEPVKIS